jgi:precorrin-6A/cobalt-precorrin-6A reductase
VRVLLLGGTAEARDLARLLDGDGVEVVSSLAGRVSRPRLPVGSVRVGGFGGVEGLARALPGFDVVVDATHPFAARISASAAQACAGAGVPLLRLARPGWSALPGASRWRWAGSSQEAAERAASVGGPVFLTTGRQTLESFTGPLGDTDVLARVVDPVEVELPATWSVLLARGPYTLEGERALMREHRSAVLVTKDSGGEHTRAKLDAADELGVEVVVVRRPAAPEGVEEVGDVEAARAWVARRCAETPTT